MQEVVAQYTNEYNNGRRTVEQFLEALIFCLFRHFYFVNIVH
ncbi:hypothetical protein T10_1434 [Trichinella papuae]|uniref:Uncharacterized protein n=1 Tax=Trichinella papuae TaxID=268474 RepID=A0A0V1LYB3_9BILA|nr:hypothetical protein T10_1434 [Trichinella papuae]